MYTPITFWYSKITGVKTSAQRCKRHWFNGILLDERLDLVYKKLGMSGVGKRGYRGEIEKLNKVAGYNRQNLRI